MALLPFPRDRSLQASAVLPGWRGLPWSFLPLPGPDWSLCSGLLLTEEPEWFSRVTGLEVWRPAGVLEVDLESLCLLPADRELRSP